MNIAVIPARGGSKRIPHKNIRNFCGQPLIAYSIRSALQSKLFDKVIVSTDDSEIASCAKEQGADVPFIRPLEISDDVTGTQEVMRHAIQFIEERENSSETYYCCIYPTAPFLLPMYLKQGLELIKERNCSYAFSVTSFPFPIQRALKVNADNSVDAFWPEHNTTRSQDLEDAYHDAGQFYWGTRDAFLNKQVLFSSISQAVILPRHLVQDIDTMEDWVRAEFMWKSLQAAGELEF